MRSLLIPGSLALLAHLGIFLGEIGYQPVYYEVLSAPQSVELSLTRVVLAPKVVVQKEEIPKLKPEPEPEAMVEEEKITEPLPVEPQLPDQQGHEVDRQAESVGAVLPAVSTGNRPPPYPSLARRMGLQGTVLLEVMVGTSGRPSSVQVRTSSSHFILDQAAQKAVERWRFEPAQRFGVPVVASIRIPIVFNLE
jgi:periplasmic protein TonB